MLSLGTFLPLGSLLAGVAAEAWGPQATTIAGGIGCTFWGLAMLRRFRGPAIQRLFEPRADPLT
jgi:hypothetical protein